MGREQFSGVSFHLLFMLLSAYPFHSLSQLDWLSLILTPLYRRNIAPSFQIFIFSSQELIPEQLILDKLMLAKSVGLRGENKAPETHPCG